MKIFLYLVLCLALLSCTGTGPQPEDEPDQSVTNPASTGQTDTATKPGNSFLTVTKVYDGDTVLLEDGRKIRLLGINSPEIGHGRRPAQAGGESARSWLTDKLQNQPVRLEMGAEKKDHYGRTLAHLFNAQNEHINLLLVAEGLASVEIFPPNIAYADTLSAAEQRAENAHLGIWQLPDYAPVAVDRLATHSRHGWTRVIGEIIAVQPAQHAVYLEFSDQFAVLIEGRNVPLFGDINTYLAKTVEVRGWIQRRKGRLLMRVRHPSAIKWR